jgi:predicted benzoate:H+ symporter BenE
MKRTLISLLAGLALAAVATQALADCMFNGRSYPTGSVVGDRVCTASGTWQRR